MRLYDLPRSPWCQQVRIVLALKGLPCERHIVLPGQEYESWFLGLNPLGRTPVLIDDDHVLRGAAVIMEYLDEANPDHPLVGDAPWSRAMTRMMVSLCEEVVGSAIDDLWLARHLDEEEDPTLLAELEGDVASALELLEESLPEDAAFAAGPRLTLADVAFAPFLVGLLPRLELMSLLEEHPRVGSYVERLEGSKLAPVVHRAWEEWDEMVASLAGR